MRTFELEVYKVVQDVLGATVEVTEDDLDEFISGPGFANWGHFRSASEVPADQIHTLLNDFWEQYEGDPDFQFVDGESIESGITHYTEETA